MHCATELCLSVDKLKKKKKKNKEGTMKCTEVNVYVVYILSTVKPENTHKAPRKIQQLVLLRQPRDTAHGPQDPESTLTQRSGK